MGDRANVFIKQYGFDVEAKREKLLPYGIYLYTHWCGYELPARLQEGLKKAESRWDDDPYLSRVLFQTILGKDDGVTGFGLSLSPGDNEYPLLVVDTKEQYVAVTDFPYEGHEHEAFRISFADFVKLDENTLKRFRKHGTTAPVDPQDDES
jgi:hypothetical protein